MVTTREDAIRRADEELEGRRFAGICGAYFEGDPWFEQNVPACSRQEEVELRNICPIYTCARMRGVEHCGVCQEFPCHLLLLFSAHDPTPGARVVSAAMRASLGERAWAAWARERSFTGVLCPLQPRSR
ncbi:MAG: DUF3795 domain-containing protein [Firmicutes bacterium]|nr:DUF3795 domain-containing protein [Bacillota bacterium]